jgi:steroid delta-isomerase-like uncharacterized protein
MLGPGRELVARARAQVREDLRADPYLPVILLGATLLCAFWFWHRIPNFATRDERSRLLDAMVPYARVIADPSFESLREGVAWSRVPFGATLYLFALAVLPVVAFALLTGQADAFAALAYPDWEFGFYPAWAATPRWVWTWSLAFVRLFNVAFAVGCVYLTYRLGTAMADRLTGRLAAILLTLTFGFLTIAHEGGEDMPALFFVLLALNLVYVYVETGDVPVFFAGAAAGGVAIAFKLTAAPVVFVVGLAHVLRAVTADEETVDVLLQPKVVLGGAAMGALAIALGFPTLLLVGPEPFIEALQRLHEAFPDSEVHVGEIIAEDDLVAFEGTMTGTHEGVFRGIDPTDETIEIPGNAMHRIRDGRIAETWATWNFLLGLRQLGAVDESGE